MTFTLEIKLVKPGNTQGSRILKSCAEAVVWLFINNKKGQYLTKRKKISFHRHIVDVIAWIWMIEIDIYCIEQGVKMGLLPWGCRPEPLNSSPVADSVSSSLRWKLLFWPVLRLLENDYYFGVWLVRVGHVADGTSNCMALGWRCVGGREGSAMNTARL